MNEENLSYEILKDDLNEHEISFMVGIILVVMGVFGWDINLGGFFYARVVLLFGVLLIIAPPLSVLFKYKINRSVEKELKEVAKLK